MKISSVVELRTSSGMSSQVSSAGWSGVMSMAASCVGGVGVDVAEASGLESDGGWFGGFVDDILENVKSEYCKTRQSCGSL